ncbi:MAG TPA: acyltransferase [Candidatus Acidoferrales bacterium]|nr:acyltransferase [Candidatus Acidoferrales bacterium]
MPLLLGQNCVVDPSALLGYPTGRRIELRPVRIGDGARIRSGTAIYASVEIGARFETGHNVVIREENRIGDDCAVWNNSTIDYGCVLGHRVKIHCNVYVAQYTVIEDDVFLAPGVIIANDPHPLCTKCMQGPTIKAGARIGVNATLLPHLVIGENSLVGAGSVVTRDVPPRAVVVGSPARVVSDVDSLECPFDIVKPYVDGLDVRRRPEWETVAALQRPVRRPAGGKE